jgi:hypothetical protein
MQTYAEFSEQAWLCAYYARTSRHNRVAQELWMTAKEYQRRAADLNGGVAPDIGEPPFTQTMSVAWVSMPGREQQTRELARAIWEREGRPEGQAQRHWQIAEKTVEAMELAKAEI